MNQKETGKRGARIRERAPKKKEKKHQTPKRQPPSQRTLMYPKRCNIRPKPIWRIKLNPYLKDRTVRKDEKGKAAGAAH